MKGLQAMTELTNGQRRYLRNFSKCGPNRKLQKEVIEEARRKFKANISQPTVSRMNSDAFLFLDESSGISTNRKRRTDCKWPFLEYRVWVWVEQVQRNGARLSGKNIVDKAREFWNLIKEPGENDPQFSNGWFGNLKKRMGLKLREIRGEVASTKQESIEKMPVVRELCRDYL